MTGLRSVEEERLRGLILQMLAEENNLREELRLMGASSRFLADQRPVEEVCAGLSTEELLARRRLLMLRIMAYAQELEENHADVDSFVAAENIHIISYLNFSVQVLLDAGLQYFL